MEKRKGELIAAACEKPVRLLIQYDGWSQEGDDIFKPDEDGHIVCSRFTYELRRSDWPVRVHVNPQATSKKEVLDLLKKIRKSIKRNWARHRIEVEETQRKETDTTLF